MAWARRLAAPGSWAGRISQARVALPHLVDHGGGFPQAAPAADPGHVAGLKQVRVVGHIADHHQRRQARQADQQRDRPGRVPGGRQHDEAAVTEQVVTRPERGQARILGRLGLIRRQRRPGRSMWRRISPRSSGSGLDSVSHSAWLTTMSALAQLGQAADVVLVKMGNDRGLDVAGGVAEPVQSRGEGLLRADVEPGQPAVQAARSGRRGSSRGR